MNRHQMQQLIHRFTPLMLAAAIGLGLQACSEPQALTPNGALESQKPGFAIDTLHRRHLNGGDDDLASAGLSLAELRAPAPTPANPLQPTAIELRKAAYHNNYNALLSLSDDNGFGRLYATEFSAKKSVAGTEYLLPVRYSDQRIAAIHMVQVPDNFNIQQPCLLVTAASGSRGIYGAVGVVGAWALHRGCAVATTDKGTGTGFHWLDQDEKQDRQGMLVAGNEKDAHFSATPSAARTRFQQQFPNRVATKHAHGGRMVDKDWGRFVLQASQLGFYILNEFHAPKHLPHHANSTTYFTRDNTAVIGAAISNGGAAVMRAAELDSDNWLDGIVVAEPALTLPTNYSWQLNNQAHTAQDLLVRSTQSALYSPCASLAPELQSPLAAAQLPFWQTHFNNRCEDLAAAGMVSGDSTAARASSALKKLRDNGLLVDSDPLLMLSSSILLWETVAVNYANSFASSKVEDHLCDISYAFSNAGGEPVPTPQAIKANLFSNSSGIIPVAGMQLINDQSKQGPRALYFSQDKQGRADIGFAAMQCFDKLARSERLQTAMTELQFSGDLRGKPALIVHGRADNLIQVNHTSRPYLQLNQQREGAQSQLRYIEVDKAQHFDAFLNIAPLSAQLVPLHPYFESALELMLEHLHGKSALPPSQFIVTSNTVSGTRSADSLPAIAQSASQLQNSTRYKAIQVSAEGISIELQHAQ